MYVRKLSQVPLGEFQLCTKHHFVKDTHVCYNATPDILTLKRKKSSHKLSYGNSLDCMLAKLIYLFFFSEKKVLQRCRRDRTYSA